MKWSMLRLSEASHTRRSTPPTRGAQRPPSRTQLPHRGLTLRALRQLARGHYLVLGGQTALAVRLAGVPYIVHVADELIEHGLVDRVDVPDCGAPCYTLSDLGRDTLRRGEQWWRTMNPFQRLLVEFTG